MTDKAYTPPKTNGTAPTTTVHPRPSQFAPPPKPHPRHPYRPTPTYLNRHSNGRSRFTCRRCCFFCCCWSIIVLIFIILLTCIAVAAVYFLYHPKAPNFSISSFKISQFNLTTTPSDDTTRLTTKLNITLSSKNPNKKILINYDSIAIRAYSSQVLLANGSFPGFLSPGNNVTIIHTTLAMANQVLDADSVTGLRSDLNKKRGLLIQLVLETSVKVKFDSIKVRKFGIVVTCGGIHAVVPSGKNHTTRATTSNADCKVDFRFKIWKITF